MPDAWTTTAITRLKSELEGDASLSAYVEAWEIWPHDRPRAVPDVRRHGGALFPVAEGPGDPYVPLCHEHEFEVGIRLFVFIWDPTDEAAAVTGTSTAGGPGSAQVGILQFLRDVKTALRGNTLSGHLQATYLEGDAGQRFDAPPPERERVFVEALMSWRGRKFLRVDGSDG